MAGAASTTGLRRQVLSTQPASAINAFARTGVELIPEDVLAGTLYLQTLPLAYDPANDRLLKRGRTRFWQFLWSCALPSVGAWA